MVTSPPDATQRGILGVLVVAQVLSGAGLAAGITVGALLAQQMLGGTDLAGLPSALFTIGSSAAAVLIGGLSQTRGRRIGLTSGYLAGALGALGVVAAATLDSAPLLFVALFVYGAGTATNLQARYAGADLASPRRRGRATGTVLVATTLGGVVAPLLTTATGAVVAPWGVPRLAGPFLLAAVAYVVAAAVLALRLRPDPLLCARERAAVRGPEGGPSSDPVEPEDPGERAAARAVVRLGGAVMLLTQLVMIAIMTMTPVHMAAGGLDLTAVGLVVAVHGAAMFLPSPLSGWLVDRVGRVPVAVASGATLVVAGVIAATAPTDSIAALALALALLGLGWNLGLVSGTAIVTDAVPLAARARTQGLIDFGIAVSGAGGGLASGLVVAAAGFPFLALAGATVALAVVPVALAVRRAAPGTHTGRRSPGRERRHHASDPTT